MVMYLNGSMNTNKYSTIQYNLSSYLCDRGTKTCFLVLNMNTRFEGFTMVEIHIIVFWVMTPCSSCHRLWLDKVVLAHRGKFNFILQLGIDAKVEEDLGILTHHEER